MPHVYRCPGRTEITGSCEAGVTSVCEPSYVGIRNRTLVFWKEVLKVLPAAEPSLQPPPHLVIDPEVRAVPSLYARPADLQAFRILMALVSLSSQKPRNYR